MTTTQAAKALQEALKAYEAALKAENKAIKAEAKVLGLQADEIQDIDGDIESLKDEIVPVVKEFLTETSARIKEQREINTFVAEQEPWSPEEA
jgi:hypothetical protein